MLDVRLPFGFDVGSACAALLAQLCLHWSGLSLRSCSSFSVSTSSCFSNHARFKIVHHLVHYLVQLALQIRSLRHLCFSATLSGEIKPLAAFYVAALKSKCTKSERSFHTVSFCKVHSRCKAESMFPENGYLTHTPPAFGCLTCCVPMGIASARRLFRLATWYVLCAASHWGLRLPCVFFCWFHMLRPMGFLPCRLLLRTKKNIPDARALWDFQIGALTCLTS